MRKTLLLAFLALLPACATTDGPTLIGRGGGEVPPAVGDRLPADFLAAELATGVPAELLFAIAWSETRLQMVWGEEEFRGKPAAYGVMALRGDLIDDAARELGVSMEAVRGDRATNVLAAATLLADGADFEGIDVTDIEAMAPVVARLSGIKDPEAVAEYVHYQVYATLARGVSVEGFVLQPLQLVPDFRLPEHDGYRNADNTVWTASPNYNSRGGASADFVIIHTCEGSYSGCWGWLTSSGAGVSAHYVVNDSGSEVRQLVNESDRAWHISAKYDCNNNGGEECWRNGKSMNTASIGIEHAGYGSQSSWDPAMIQRSAELVCAITQRHNIPRDAAHIVGHGQLQPWNRSDPGASWPWADYLRKVHEACGDVPSNGGNGNGNGNGNGSSRTVIDSNNAANDTANYYVETSGAWWGSANVSGYFNTGYWVAPTQPVSDPANFWFRTPTSGCFTVDAWWTAASDRPAAVTFIGYAADDTEIGRSTVDQRSDGGRWNRLGKWKFTKGWNRVALSRWAPAGSYVVADALRLTPGACP